MESTRGMPGVLAIARVAGLRAPGDEDVEPGDGGCRGVRLGGSTDGVQHDEVGRGCGA